MLIKDRVKLIITSNRETSSSFADKIGVKRSNLSHVLSGRNKPSLDFLEKILNYYPNVNASWLITGKIRNEKPEQDILNVTNVNTKVNMDLQSRNEESQDLFEKSKGLEIEKVIVFYVGGKIKEYNYFNQ